MIDDVFVWGCLIFRHPPLIALQKLRDAQKCQDNYNERRDFGYLLSMIGFLLAGKFLFKASYETSFINHILTFVLAVFRDGGMIVLGRMNHWIIGTTVCAILLKLGHAQAIGVSNLEYLQQSLPSPDPARWRPEYVMSTPDQRPVWWTEKPGGLLLGLSKTRVL